VTETSTTGNVSGNVPGTLSLTLGNLANLGPLRPGVAADYTASLAGVVTSTAGDATLSVADPSSEATGRLVNGTRALESPIQAMATNAAQPTSAFAPVTGSANPLTILRYPSEIATDAVTITFKQSISANEGLRSGTYSKTLTFTLSTTTP
jgi:hypothetical protein